MLGKTGVSRAENRYFRGKNMKKGTGFLTLFGGAVALYALLAAPVSMRAQETETIEDGVYIGNIYVGGMTEEEAVSAVEAYVESADSAEMTLKTGDKSVSVTAADLGISFSNLNVVDEAIDVGRSGNLIKRYKDKKDLQQGDKVIALSLDVDSDAVASILSEKAAQLNQEAVDNGLVRTVRLRSLRASRASRSTWRIPLRRSRTISAVSGTVATPRSSSWRKWWSRAAARKIWSRSRI